MRVIAGTAKGTKLKTPKGTAVRPTADRVKEALFNIIGARVEKALFLDLYAGSGAVGIEALSRGARLCIFVDNKKENLALIKENLDRTKLGDRARLIRGEVEEKLSALARDKIKADLVYLDPPYEQINIAPVAQNIIKQSIIADNGLIIVEHSHSNRQWLKEFDDFKQKKYGDTCLTVIHAF